ncbi:hypothetical protein EMGBS1_07210 [Chloroflexota bacterium]|nr:hypothetical protein EMGBS1_07210 [Chloroflexota bacterium]
MTVLAVVGHDRGSIEPASLGVLTAAGKLAAQLHTSMEALTIGANADGLRDILAAHGASVVHQAHHPALVDYGPEAWGEVIAQMVRNCAPKVVMGSGTERGHEVIAQAAARLDLPAAMNCTEFDATFDGSQALRLVRARWGGSLLEQSELAAPVKLVTLANHMVVPVEAPASGSVSIIDVELDAAVRHSFVRERVDRIAGVTLATAPVWWVAAAGLAQQRGLPRLRSLPSCCMASSVARGL